MQRLIARMKKYSTEPDENGCIHFTGAKRSGYGVIRAGKKMTGAHRLSYTLHKGEIPEGMFVCHACDIKSCINPDHLFLGTHTDNMRDMHSKGRWKSKAKNADRTPYKLNIDQAREILNDPRTYNAIAADYGITRFTVSNIKNRHTWKQLEIRQRRLKKLVILYPGQLQTLLIPVLS